MALPKKLSKIKTSLGERLITGELEYQIILLLEQFSVDEIEALLTEKGPYKYPQDAYFDLPFFDSAKQKVQLTYETYLGKTIPAEGLACVHCGSTNVTAAGKYNRALDEAGSVRYHCRNCGKSFFD